MTNSYKAILYPTSCFSFINCHIIYPKITLLLLQYLKSDFLYELNIYSKNKPHIFDFKLQTTLSFNYTFQNMISISKSLINNFKKINPRNYFIFFT
jgi:hypothetical protein